MRPRLDVAHSCTPWATGKRGWRDALAHPIPFEHVWFPRCLWYVANARWSGSMRCHYSMEISEGISTSQLINSGFFQAFKHQGLSSTLQQNNNGLSLLADLSLPRWSGSTMCYYYMGISTGISTSPLINSSFFQAFRQLEIKVSLGHYYNKQQWSKFVSGFFIANGSNLNP